MKQNQLRDLIAVAEQGGLRRAARHLGLAQPALTRSIRELEHELGATLFERSATGMALTPIGQAFTRRCIAVQQEIDRARDEVQQMKGIASGSVSIALSTAPHLSMLPRVLGPFQQRYPAVQLNIVETLFPAIKGDLREGAIDFYVGPLAEAAPGAEYRVERLFDNYRIVLGRRDHPMGGVRSLRDLANARWVTTSVTANSEAELFPIFQRLGLPDPKITVLAHSALSMITVAASSDALAMLPQQWLGFAKTSGLLHHFALEEELVAPPICIVARSGLPLTPVAEHLCDLFRRSALNQAKD